MDQYKITAVKDWLKPNTVKNLQHILGFPDLYRCFIQGFSSIANLLTTLLRKGPKKLKWNWEADQALA